MSKEIIKVKNSSYARYEEVLMQRDALQKEAFMMQTLYMAEFGDLIIEVFEKKIECIRKKKTIEFIQAALNRGQMINREELQAYLAKEMEEFNNQMEELIENNKRAKDRETISEYDLLKIKRIYHKLVKMIHPDINPMTEENELLSELWARTQLAYKCNNLKDMEELEILVPRALEQLGIGSLEIEIPNIEEKIAQTEAEIKRIRETDPYLYKEILEDAKAVEEKKKTLKEELKSYEDYSDQLEKVIEGLMSNGGAFVWQMN